MANQGTKTITSADFQTQADASAGVMLEQQAKMALIKAIKGTRRATDLGKRIVLWMIESASWNLSTPIEVSLYYETWGDKLAREIQLDADTLSRDAMTPLWFACGVGRHLTHHTGGRDNLQRWSPYVRACTLWIAEGDDIYNKKSMALVIKPSLAEIGSISLK